MKDPNIIQYKNDLDAIAETGWNEVKTTAYIDSVIKQKSLVNGVGEKKVGRTFSIGKGSEKIFLRADIDALPSKNGVKHICGHSTHMASLLGTFQWALSKELELTKKNKQIIFIFQPAEETFPSGAHTIIQSQKKLLKQCLYGFGIHVMPDIPAGYITVEPGILAAAGDYIEIEVKGKSTHIKATHEGIDAIEGAAYVIQEFKNFQKSLKTFGTEVVFNINTIKGGTAPNRVADTVLMTGDIRWFEKKYFYNLHSFCTNLPDVIEKKYKGKVKVKYYVGYPPLINDKKLSKVIKKYITSTTSLKIYDKLKASLITEDFSFYSDVAPTLYTKIGVGNKNELHDDAFEVPNESVLLAYEYWKSVIDWWLFN